MKNLDDKIKDAFNTKESQLDKMDLWDAIEKELPEEKKDRKFFIWFFFGGLMIIFVGVLFNRYFYSSKDLSNQSQVVDYQLTQNSNWNELNSSPIIDSILCADEKAETKNKIKPLDSSVSKILFTQSKLKNSESITQKKDDQDLIYKTKKETSFTTNKIDLSLNQSKNLTSKPINLIDEMNKPPLFSRKEVQFLEVPIPLLDYSKLIDTILFPNEVNWVISEHQPSKWSTKLYANYQFITRSFSGNDQDYFDQKSTDEKIRYNFNTGALVNFDLTSKLAIGIGIDYTVQEEVINWSGVVSTNEIPFQSDSAFFFNYFQKTFYVSGTSISREISTRNLRNYNRIQQWSIPIEVNYTAIQKSRWNLYLTGGTKFNLSNKLEGKYLGINGEIKEGDAIYDLYKKANVHTWYGGLGIEVFLNSKLSVTSDFRYQSSFNIFQDDLEVALKHRGYSIGLGLKRMF